MSEQNANSNPVMNSQVIRNQIVERLHKGNIVYERDMTALAQELELMNRLNQASEAGLLFTAMGAIELHRGHFVAAYDYAMSALPYFTQVGDQDGVIATLCKLGEISRRWEKFDEARAYLVKASDLARESRNNEVVASVYSSSGMLFLDGGNAVQAMAHFEDALQRLSGLPKSPSIENLQAEIYNGMALITLEKSDFEGAWEYAHRSREIAAQYARVTSMGAAYRTLGAVACKAHTADAMLNEQPQGYFDRSKELFRLSGARAELAHTLIVEGRWQRSRHQNKEANALFTEAEQLLNQVRLYEKALAVRRLRGA